MIGEGRFLVVAAVLHGALPVAAAIAPESSSGAWRSAQPSERIEVDIDLAASEVRRTRAARPRTRRGGPPSDEAQPEERTDDRRLPRRRRPGEVMTANPEPSADEDREFTISPDREGPDPLGRAPSAGEVDGIGTPGLPGPYSAGAAPMGPDSGPAPAPTTTPEREYDEDSGTKAMKRKMLAEDKEKGLDFPGRGPIRAAFTGATWASAPRTCKASFSVTVGPSGKVTDVSLLGFTGGDAQTWNAVKKAAASQLSGVKLVMRSAYENGATVGVSIRSSEQAPSGSDGPSLDGASLEGWDVADIGAKPVRRVTVGVNPQPIVE